MKQMKTSNTSGVLCGVLIALSIFLVSGCSMSFRDRLSVEPVYVTYTVILENRKFPPESFLTKMNLYFDHEQLLYVKNRNDFMLKYRDPSVVLTDRGLSIDFGLLPSAVFSSGNEITLYFIPLEKGDVHITGELLRRKKELILGPRNPAVIERIPEETAHCPASFGREPLRAEGFYEIARKHKAMVAPEYLKGRGMNLFIPGDRVNTAGSELENILRDSKFVHSYSVRFESGGSDTFTRVSEDGLEIVELRATMDRNGTGEYLYLYAFGNTPVDDIIENISGRFRNNMPGE